MIALEDHEGVTTGRSARYRVLRALENPGPGVLAVAHDLLRGSEVVVRIVSQTTEATAARAVSEFHKLIRVEHPSLAQTFDYGRTADGVFYTRELAEHPSLDDTAGRDSRESVVFKCLSGVAAALSELHDAGCVHGLVVPSCIRIEVGKSDRLGGVRLIDAGLRSLLSDAHLEDVRKYDAPEVRAGALPSPAGDAYQLGASLVEAVGGAAALARLRDGKSKPFRSQIRGVDRRLLDLLDDLVAPDPRERPTSREIVEALRSRDWVLPESSRSVASLTSPALIGRDRELAQCDDILERAAKGSAHAVTITGQRGVGRSRLLEELGIRGKTNGWVVIDVSSVGRADPVAESVTAIMKAVGGVAFKRQHAARQRGALLVARDGSPDDYQRLTFAAHTLCQAVEKAAVKLLLLADNTEEWPLDLLALLKYVVTEAHTLPILIASTGLQGDQLPGAEVVSVGALDDLSLRRFTAPLLAASLNPEETFSALRKASGGNPLWVNLHLASWMQSGQLRFVHNRPFFDEKGRGFVPQTLAEIIEALVSELPQAELKLVEALAIWGKPLPASVAEKLLGPEIQLPESILVRDEQMVRFRGESIRAVVIGLIPAERRRQWHERILAVAEDLSLGERGVHLVGAGKIAEGIHRLIEAAQEAESRGAYRSAFEHLRVAQEYLHDHGNPVGIDQTRLVLDSAQAATRVGELRWARAVLEDLKAHADEIEGEPAERIEFVLVRANVLRELRHSSEAAPLYAEARVLALRSAKLRQRLPEILLEEAANDAFRGEAKTALERVEPLTKELQRTGPAPLFALALKRMAMLYAHLGRAREAAVYELGCGRLARKLDDCQLAARSFVTLGGLYHRMNRPQRALAALDRAHKSLLRCPHDGLEASELVNRAEILLRLGRSEEVESLLLRARALRERSGQRGRLPAVLIDLGRFYRHRGRLADAAHRYREAVAIAEEFDLPIVQVARANLGEVLLHHGQYAAAEPLLRLALSDDRPDHRGLVLVNLGRLLRESKQYPAAIQQLEEAESLLAKSLPGTRQYAVIEAARAFLEAGDVEAAASRLARIDGEKRNAEQLAEYELVGGLVTAERGDAPDAAFDGAIAAARETGDPTLLGEILIAAVEGTLTLENADPIWVSQALAALEETVGRTDAPPVHTGVRLARCAAEERFRTASQSDALAKAFLQNAKQGRTPIDLALGEMVDDLDGAAGAVVFVVGLGPDGKPLASQFPKRSSIGEGIRPYRLAAREFDRRIFREALEATGGNALEAARLLRLPTSTFRYRAEKLKLLKPIRREKT